MKNIEKDVYYFHQGTHYRAYNFLGAHHNNGHTRFITFAPNATHVQLACDLNRFSGEGMDFKRITQEGLWMFETTELIIGDIYKYKIYHHDQSFLKSDPFGQFHELRPKTASIIYNSEFTFTDEDWMNQRKKRNLDMPINIYEMHLGTWMRHPVEWDETKSNDKFTDQAHYSYIEIAESLIPYLKKMNYNFVEFMPLTEHPFDLSWGYQTTGYFSATSRYGKPDDLKYLVNELHRANIGVIMDFVPAHFCKDAHGLRMFDGTPLFEHPDPYIADKRQWGTLTFDYGRNEVQSFLVSSAMFWLKEFHFDGLRIDAVHSMIDLNFENHEHHEKIYNEYGDERNLQGIELLKKMNSVIHAYDDSVLMIAEDSSSTSDVTTNVEQGGLGFDLKWDLGWMNDRLKFINLDFRHRTSHHQLMTFTHMYKYNEKFVLALSHDEVVHGKYSIVSKMQGDVWQQFAGAKLLYGNQMTEPGKKLLFMGQEIGQLHEWREYEELSWKSLNDSKHETFQKFVQDLNKMYLTQPELYKKDFESSGFKWLIVDDYEHSIFSYTRHDGDDFLIVILNYKPDVYYDFKLPVPEAGSYKEILNSDCIGYGGSGVVNPNVHYSFDEQYLGESQFILVSIAPLSIQVFKRLNYGKEQFYEDKYSSNVTCRG